MRDYIDDGWYATAALSGVFGRRIAAWHYLHFGESRGLWPNPLFDPNFYREAAALADGRSCLVDFAARPPGDRPQPNSWFDVNWYEWQNRGALGGSCGLLHYLRTGGRHLLDPCPRVDMIALARSHGEFGDGVGITHELACARLCPQGIAAITPSEEVLVERQQALVGSIDPQILVSRPVETARRHLVFVQCAPGSQFWNWYDPGAERSWDLLLNCYSGPPAPAECADHIVVQAGTKITAMHLLWSQHRAIFDGYDRILFIDDDLCFRFDDIGRLFEMVVAADLDLAQPSLDETSHISWPIFAQHASRNIRRVNGVEIMMPVFSRRAREVCFPDLYLSVSGYGLDLRFAQLAARRGLKAGVVDDVVAHHGHPVSLTGAYYEFLRSHAINPRYEFWRLIEKFGIEREFRALD